MYAEVIERVTERNTDPANAEMKWLCDTLTINDRIKSAAELSRHWFFEGRVVPPPIRLDKEVLCYQCCTKSRRMHGVYVMCCAACGSRNLAAIMYQQSAHVVQGRAFVVVGGRTKIGYQVALRLLRNGAAHVSVTTRDPHRAFEVYAQEPDFDTWKHALIIHALDLNTPVDAVQAQLQTIVASITDLHKVQAIDALFNVAAQTIRGIERHATTDVEANRYGNARHFPADLPNSWSLTLPEVSPQELEEVMRVNAMGPVMVVQAMLPLLRASDWERRCIVNTHAREGCFTVAKNAKHPHTNMAKAALHMLTVMINASGIHCFGVDPGWVSVDEYSKADSPMPSAPLTEIDGAARLLHPLLSSVYKRPHRYNTMRHFDNYVL